MTRRSSTRSNLLKKDVQIGKGANIHKSAIVGFPNRDSDTFIDATERLVQIGKNSIVYPWALIYEGAIIGEQVEIHERCTVGSKTTIGKRSLVLYGAQIHDNCEIGQSCVVGGFVADNCRIGDGSSIFGALVHKYGTPGRRDWDDTDEAGPIVGKNVVVGWGAVIVGPVTIGDDSWIAPNCVVTEDVPPGHRCNAQR